MQHHPIQERHRRGPCGCFSRDGGTWLQNFRLLALPLFTHEERFTGCVSAQAAKRDIAEEQHAGSPHIIPPTGAASNTSVNKFSTHFSFLDALPNDIPSKLCSLQNQIPEAGLGLSPLCALNGHSPFYLGEPFLSPFSVEIMLRPKSHL